LAIASKGSHDRVATVSVVWQKCQFTFLGGQVSGW